MRINVSATLAMLLIIAAVSVVPASAQTQSASSTQPGAELALTYNYLHSNVNSSGLDLMLTNFLLGGRYSLRHFSRFTPYGQLLVGASHASGSLAPGQLAPGSSTAFAMAAGGGLDLTLTRHLAIRLVQTDYLLTLLPNQSNDHQNNFRLSMGVVYHWNRK